MPEMIRKHVIAIIGAILLILSLISTAYGIDKRYMKVSDYEAAQTRIQIQTLEDRVFELDFKSAEGVLAPIDHALIKRFRERLQALRAYGIEQ